MSKTVAFLAGLGAGYLNAEDRKKRDARQAKLDERDQVRFDNEQDDRTQRNADRDALRTAAAPVTVAQAPEFNADGAGDYAMPNPDAGKFKVGARTFAERGAADAAATQENAPERRSARVYAALAAQDPVKAEQYRATTRQGEAADMQLTAAKRKEVDDAYNRDLITRAVDFTSLESFVNDSQGDGQGGALKIKFVPSADGKTVQALTVGADGSTKPTPYSFPNTQEGLQRAVGTIGMRMSAEQKLAHLQGIAKTDEDRKRWDAEFGLKKQNADTLEAYRRDMARASNTRAAGAGKDAAPGQITMKDMRDFEQDVTKSVNDIFQPKEGMTQEERAALGAQRDGIVTQANAIFRANATRGNPLTAGDAIAAIKMASDPKNVRNMQGSDGMVYPTVLVHGAPVIVGGPQTPKAPPAAAPGAAPAPAQMAQQGVQTPTQPPTPTTPPAAAPAQQQLPPGLRPSGNAALDKVLEQNLVAMEPLNTQVAAAEAYMAAAAKSGDPKALQSYAARLQMARDARNAKAREAFGNNADAYLQSIAQ